MEQVSGDSSEEQDLTPAPPKGTPLSVQELKKTFSIQACTEVRKDKDEPFPADSKSEVPFANFAN